MKAIRMHEFGGPEVLQLEEAARPVPAADEVLVRVHASGVNRAELRVRSGAINHRMPVPLPFIPGSDFAGIVAEVGAEVTAFRPGEAVYGVANFPGSGTYAEYAVAKTNQVGHQPGTVDFVHAAAVPLAALTAWEGLYPAGHLRPGERLLIHGASGGVGSFAVQLAKWTGAYVIATASAANQEFVRRLGADEVLDYTQPLGPLPAVDIVFDGVGELGPELQFQSIQLLRAGGRLVSVQFIPLAAEVQQALDRQGATGVSFGVQLQTATLDQLARLIDQGHLRPVVAKVYPLAQAADAHRDLERRGTQGKIVLEVQSEA